MKAQQMAAFLRKLDPLFEASLAWPQLQSMRRFADAIELGGGKTVGMVVKTVEAKISNLGDRSSVSTAGPLTTLSEALSAAGITVVSKELAIVAALLGRLGALDAENVYLVVSSALAPPAKKAPSKKARLKEETPPIDPRAAADRLLAASSDNQAFDKLLDELNAASMPVLRDIAKRYLGFERSFRTKGEVLKSIRSRQLQDAIQESRERRISKIAV